MNKKSVSWLNLLLFFIVVVVNYLTATGKIPGLSPQREVSNLYDTPITPAGFAFSIWGLIYLLLFVVIVYMIHLSSDRSHRSDIVNEITRPLLGIFVFNVVWNIVFGMKWIGISFLMIIGYWISLIFIGTALSRSRIRLNPIFPVAFGIHTGWITIASVVNLYAFFVKLQWGIADRPQVWMTIGIVLAVVLVAVLQVFLRNAVLPFATAWALFGIYAKDSVIYTQYPFLSILLLLGIALLIVFVILTFLKNKKFLLP